MGDSGGNSRMDSPLNNGRDSKSSEIDSPPSMTYARSNSSSPLLDTAPLPIDDPTLCPYCHKDFRKPRVLDCLHSMCEDCIIAQLDGRREAEKAQELAQRSALECELETPSHNERPTPPGVIRCPICTQESHVGNDVRYVHSMLVDYVRMSEVEDIRGGERSCRACKSQQSAVAVCKQCAADLCSTCFHAHQNMRMFDGHQTMPYDDLALSGFRSEARVVLCPTHGQPFKMLCATCEALGCKTCLELEHGSNHKLIEVNQMVVVAIQKELIQLSSKVNNKWKESMSQWSTIPDRHSNLQTQYENAKARIDIAFEEVIKAVEEMKNKKISELDAARDKQDDLISELYRKVDVTQARVSDAVGFTNRLVEKSNGMELLASRRKVIQQLTNLQHTMPVLTTQFELEYQPLQRKHLDAQLSSACGTVSCRTVSSAVKEGPGTPVESVNANAPRPSSDSTDWRNSSRAGSVTANGPSSTMTTSTSSTGAGPGAIGMERKKFGSTARNEFNNGWPPSSNPPDLPSPSPPKDPNNANTNSASTGSLGNINSIYNSYQWPPSSNPVPTSAPTPDPRSVASALLGSGTANVLPFAAPPNVPLSAAQIQAQQIQLAKAALIMQQNNPLNNPLLQARFRNLAVTGIDPLNVSLSALSLDPATTAALSALRAPPTPADSLALGSKNFHPELRMHSVFGSGLPGQSLRELHTPGGFCLADNDDILIADTNNHRIMVCGPPHPWTFGRPGQEDGCLCYPRKVVALKGDSAKGDSTKYVVIDKGPDSKSRAQLFDLRGDFIRRINLHSVVAKGGVDVQAACATLAGHLVIVDHCGVVYSLDVEPVTPRVVGWFDTTPRLGEATDVAVFNKNVYITDFKNHCVHVFSVEGNYVKKLGEPSSTPYPIGVDVSKSGDVLVADTHGNHLHLVIFNDERPPQPFTHGEFKMSRCVGLRVAASGHIVTLSKQAHTLFVFKALYIR